MEFARIGPACYTARRRMKQIGLYIERQRAWGRCVCEGIAAYAQDHPDWTLHMLEVGDLAKPKAMRSFDGFIARIPDARTAARFQSTRKPVADMTNEGVKADNFIAGVQHDNLAIGQIAARHFLEHRFTNFAFCGYEGIRFSCERRDSYRRCLRLNRYPCAVYESAYDNDARATLSDRIEAGKDAVALGRWLLTLPRPCAVFCVNDIRCYQVVKACRSACLQVPKDIALLGVDNDTLVCNFVSPMLSSIDPDAFQVGRATAERIDRCLDGALVPPDGRMPRVSPRELVVRASSQTFPVSPDWLSDALVFIRRNYHRHLTASAVYAYLNRSHTRIDAAFRAQLGTTVQQEIRRVSLAEAERLLRLTELSVAEIANRAGFASQQYFCNVFTSANGLSPSLWRRKSRESPDAGQ